MSAAEEASVSSSRESEADSIEQHAHSDTSKDDSALPSTAEESNDTTLSALSNTSSKCDSRQDLENSDKKSLDGTNVSKTKTQKSKIKVVQSRYKAAAAAATKNSNNSSGNNNSSSSGSQSRSWSNETLPARPPPAGKRLPPKTKPKRATIPIGHTTTTTIQPATPRFQTPQTGGAGSAAKPRTAKPGASKPSKVNRSILHSTALNMTLMGDVTSVKSGHPMLSSTLLGGVTPGPGGFKQTPAGASLMELPDLSVINPEGNNSGNRTILSSVSEEPQIDIEGTTTTTTTTALPEVTAEVLEQEFMRYLQWAYVDVHSELAFAAQLKEMQNQIAFLEELVGDKQQEVSELRQKSELFQHQQRVGEAFDVQTKLLQALNDDLPACEEAERTMERELEKKLHQVKMENIYIPQDHVKYREELTDALSAQISLLHELGGSMEARTQHGGATIKLLADLQSITELVQRSEKEMQQAAGLAVEDASHQLGTKAIILDDAGFA
ncbi:uncharacterized protein LOC127003010 [Eriocheir sinensis]|uniref:uncharacterized protein LOC127003010 n=1 Tax=Eriocheir sinensis TaxID=95602 RepID=UPI0021C95D42|nr:uncharacterized protein LOC127003010 [Eriocheir sinensis]XP_050725322.1 uncharacterized protein LOC127003010 [Eriocheir sinensis]XP_050725323.1 uncharacterized protein LOC127003010 [Eriocheir sinensis]XP_050725324.1 uncharacterized protein LOC127003010 [Eriocheir sinensis]